MQANATRTGGDYRFTNDWFDGCARGTWDQLFPQLRPSRILEVGSYEGASACYVIDKLAQERSIELHCIDTWQGSADRPEQRPGMQEVEARFIHNTSLALRRAGHPVDFHVHKGRSDEELPKLLASGKRAYFDFIYIDGSHDAPDVLCDAVMCFRLLRKDGLMAFDDYLWQEHFPQGIDPVRCPKPAIDAFTNIYCRQLRVLSAPLYQLYVQKVAG